MGENLPIHVYKVDIPDGVPSKQELREVVWPKKAEHIKVWLCDMLRKEEEAGSMGRPARVMRVKGKNGAPSLS